MGKYITTYTSQQDCISSGHSLRLIFLCFALLLLPLSWIILCVRMSLDSLPDGLPSTAATSAGQPQQATKSVYNKAYLHRRYKHRHQAISSPTPRDKAPSSKPASTHTTSKNACTQHGSNKHAHIPHVISRVGGQGRAGIQRKLPCRGWIPGDNGGVDSRRRWRSLETAARVTPGSG